MTLVDVEILLLIVVPALPALASLILVWKGGWRDTSPSLRERTLLALRDWLVASAVASIALSRLLSWGWPTDVTLVVLATALLLVSLPSAYWLWLYFTGRFRGSVR